MNKKMLMLMSNRRNGEKGRRVGVEYEDWGVRDNMDMGMPRREYYPDRIRSEHSDVYRPRMGMMEPDDRAYRRYSDGRFAPRSDYSEPWMDHHRTPTTFDEGERRMNPIGFARDMGGSDATMPHYQEMDRMGGDGMARGYSRSEYAPHFDRRMAEEWAENMENEDGTRGPHWTLEQAKQVMAQRGIEGSPLAFWVALSMMYSDYCKVAKKLGVNTVEFYACMAEAFLDDKDAVGGGGGEKLAAYYDAVVKH